MDLLTADKRWPKTHSELEDSKRNYLILIREKKDLKTKTEHP